MGKLNSDKDTGYSTDGINKKVNEKHLMIKKIIYKQKKNTQKK